MFPWPEVVASFAGSLTTGGGCSASASAQVEPKRGVANHLHGFSGAAAIKRWSLQILSFQHRLRFADAVFIRTRLLGRSWNAAFASSRSPRRVKVIPCVRWRCAGLRFGGKHQRTPVNFHRIILLENPFTRNLKPPFGVALKWFGWRIGDNRGCASGAARCPGSFPPPIGGRCSCIIPVSALGCWAKCRDGTPPPPADSRVNGGGGASGHPVRKLCPRGLLHSALCVLNTEALSNMRAANPGSAEAAVNKVAGKYRLLGFRPQFSPRRYELICWEPF